MDVPPLRPHRFRFNRWRYESWLFLVVFLVVPGMAVLGALAYLVWLGLSDLFGETLTALVFAILLASVLFAAAHRVLRGSGRERSH